MSRVQLVKGLFVIAVATVAVTYCTHKAWPIDRDGYYKIQRAQAEQNGDDQRLRVYDFISKAGTLRYPPGNSTYAGQTYRVPCCGQADAYEADEIEVDANGDLWAVLTCNDPEDCQEVPGKIVRPVGAKFKVPAYKILVNQDPVNNTNHGWIWISPSANDAEGNPIVYCFSFGVLN